MRQYNAEFVEQPAKLVDLHDANPDQLLAYAVHCKHGLLLFGLDGHESHAWTLGSFPDRRGVGRVILVRLHEWPNELSGDEPHVVTTPSQDPSPVMRAAAGFHNDAASRPVDEERHELSTFERLAMDRAGLGFDVMNLENAFGQVDGNGRGFHLVLLGGWTAERAMSHASGCKPAALDGPLRREATIPSIWVLHLCQSQIQSGHYNLAATNRNVDN